MDDTMFEVREGFGSDRALAAALQQLPHVVTLFLGPEHVITALNDASLEIYGFNPIGLRIVDFIEGAEAQGVVALYDRVYAGETIRLEAVRFAVNTPTGHSEEFFIDNTMIPFRDREGRIIGTLVSGNNVTARVRRERRDREAADELAHRYRRATDLVAEIQRALLPSRLPTLPAVDVSACYAVGGVEQAAGGDWFDVFPRPDGSVVAVIGDVVGHGVDAAAVMAQLRAVALERLHAGVTIEDALTALDRFVDVMPAGRASTACLLELDAATGSFAYVSAGHPPPLVLDPDRGSSFAAPTGEPPIGATARRARRTGTLGDAQVLLLYTDGIVERPGVMATAGQVQLREVATDAVADRLYQNFSLPAAVDRATAQTFEHLTRETGSHDDITIVALQRARPLAPLDIALQIARASTSTVRQALRAWFRPGQVDGASLDALDQIVTELCENAIEHAYGNGTGPLHVTATLDGGGAVTLTIADRGAWRPPPQPNAGRGLGLALVRELATRLVIDPSEDGTTVTAVVSPWKRSTGTTAPTPAAVPAVADVYVEQRAGQNVLTATGPIDTAVLSELHAHLALVTAPGSPALVIDLDGVTLLSSVAVQTLHRALADASASGVVAHVRARPGTVAHQVLTLVGIDTVDRGTGNEGCAEPDDEVT